MFVGNFVPHAGHGADGGAGAAAAGAAVALLVSSHQCRDSVELLAP